MVTARARTRPCFPFSCGADVVQHERLYCWHAPRASPGDRHKTACPGRHTWPLGSLGGRPAIRDDPTQRPRSGGGGGGDCCGPRVAPAAATGLAPAAPLTPMSPRRAAARPRKGRPEGKLPGDFRATAEAGRPRARRCYVPSLHSRRSLTLAARPSLDSSLWTVQRGRWPGGNNIRRGQNLYPSPDRVFGRRAACQRYELAP